MVRPATGLLALLLLAGPAGAAGPIKAGPPQTGAQPTQAELIDRLVADLDAPEPPRRVFAARELEHRVKNAVRLSRSTRGDPLSADAAMQELLVYDDVLAPRCLAALGDEHISLPCIEILGLLETSAARAPLQALLEAGPTRRARRKIARALHRIGPSESKRPEGPPS